MNLMGLVHIDVAWRHAASTPSIHCSLTGGTMVFVYTCGQLQSMILGYWARCMFLLSTYCNIKSRTPTEQHIVALQYQHGEGSLLLLIGIGPAVSWVGSSNSKRVTGTKPNKNFFI
jgi:hypothetical protein